MVFFHCDISHHMTSCALKLVISHTLVDIETFRTSRIILKLQTENDIQFTSFASQRGCHITLLKMPDFWLGYYSRNTAVSS